MLALLSGVWVAVAAAVVLCLPGIAWLAWTGDPEKDFFERLAEALGLSISLAALAALVLFLAGLSLPGAAVVAIYGLLALAAFPALRRSWLRRVPKALPDNSPGPDQVSQEAPHPLLDEPQGASSRWPLQDPRLRSLVLGLVLIAVLGWRFYQVRELVLPAWVDSVHHVLVVRVILETGGLPATLDPYLPVPFYYHFAFHILAAIFSFFTRLAPAQGVLLFGQVLNAAVALSLYRLAMALWRDWRRGLLAVLLVGFVSQMPAYYATWGRYTLLVGLVLLPLAMADSLEIVAKGASRARLAKLSVLTAGLLLSHYFAGFLLALFLVFLGFQALYRSWRGGAPGKDRRWLYLIGSALAGALLAAPWVYRAWFYTRASLRFGTLLPSSAAVDAQYFPNYLQYLWHLLGPERSRLLLFLAPAGLVLALLSSRSRAFALWAVFLGLLSLPWGPYVTPFRPDHAVIVLFLPVTLLVAALFTALSDGSRWLARRLGRERLAWAGILPVWVSFMFLLVWGLRETGTIINPSTVLADSADLQAVRWIGAHTPQQSRFFINVTPWQYGLYRGVDGGWWITPLTGRETVLPPALYSAGAEEYIRKVNSLAEGARTLEDCQPEFWQFVKESGMTHLYLGSRFGPLRPVGLEGCPHVRQLYAREGVFIYEIVD
jgi:hypothetical protein